MSGSVYNEDTDMVSADSDRKKEAFMIKGTPEFIAERREEIINACEKLYRAMSFKEITLKEIGSETSFSRPSIYNYFESKEEIFLALFEREYVLWTDELRSLQSGAAGMSRDALAEAIAESLEKRKLMLKLLSVNLYDMEENSRMERLVSFKLAYGASREALKKLVSACYPEMKERALRTFIFTFLPFLHGVYPYAFATKKQIGAMDEAGIAHPELTVGGLVKEALLSMLPEKE